MKHSPIRLLQTILISMTLVGAHGTAHAQCTLPNGTAGEQFYNTTHNVMQYCNGSDWVNMGAIGGGGTGEGGISGNPIIDQFQAAGIVVAPVTIAATNNKWPDYLICRDTGSQQVMIHLQNYSGGTVRYRDGASSFIYIFNTDGTYNNRDHLAANCGASGADISSICNDNRCGFFGGGGGGSDTLAGLNCANDQIAKWDGAAWVCAADETGGGGAGCAGGWAHMQIWRTGNWPNVSCGVDGHLRQCQNGLVITLATAPQDCGGG